jgi:hypothetical protein
MACLLVFLVFHIVLNSVAYNLFNCYYTAIIGCFRNQTESSPGDFLAIASNMDEGNRSKLPAAPSQRIQSLESNIARSIFRISPCGGVQILNHPDILTSITYRGTRLTPTC